MYEGAIQDLIDELGRLPGIGPRSAQRIAFHLLLADRADARRLADAVQRVTDEVRFCERCFNLASQELCRVCRDERRDGTQVCVVEGPSDVIAIERTREFRGVYHVLGGAIAPLEGVGPDDLHIRELVQRIDSDGLEEIILATNSNVEGDATASYLTRLLQPLGVRVTRIASGLPVGGDLDYADEVTLGRAFSGRRDVA